MRRAIGRETVVAGLLGLFGVVAACSPSAGTSGHGGGGLGTGGSGGDEAVGGSGTGSDTSSTGAAGSTDNQLGGPPAGSPDASGPTCGQPSFTAQRETITVDAGTVTIVRPVALFIMLDQSGSMDSAGATSGSTKWTTVKDGITSFVTDPNSKGLKAALGFFPPLFGNSGACDGTGYDTPTVPMGDLPANGANIVAKLDLPTGLGTPTEGGLRGAEKYCAQYQVDHPDEDCVVVFATDGQPSSCDTTLATLTKIVQDAHDQSHVKTFAIGMASQNPSEVDFGFLNGLAVAGGTDCNPSNPGNEACNIGGGSDLTTALDNIRTTVTKHETKTVTKTSELACEFQLPKVFNKDDVNIEFSGSSGVPETVPFAKSLDDCSKTQGKAWRYEYDANNNPLKIVLCPQTCTAINAGLTDGGFLSVGSTSAAPAISLKLGCPTQIIQ